ncbi:MAG: NAD(P)-binding domain-containing protein [Candidatus Gracilibacteria bacterium]
MLRKFKILGHPLRFCLTTPVMNSASLELGLDLSFETVDLPPEDLPNVMATLKAGELAGVITTMPFKTPSIAFLDDSSSEVKEINAVNLILNEDGNLYGHNTDWIGAVGALKTVMPNLEGKKILILGAGGAARAATYGFKKEGATITLWNRTPEKAQECAKRMGVNWIEDLNELKEKPEVIVNATAVSNFDRQKTLIPFALWENVEVAMDAVYGKTSLFLEEAKATRVKNIISGELWFLKQVFTIFEIITGKKAPEDFMTRLTNDAKEIAKN